MNVFRSVPSVSWWNEPPGTEVSAGIPAARRGVWRSDPPPTGSTESRRSLPLHKHIPLIHCEHPESMIIISNIKKKEVNLGIISSRSRLQAVTCKGLIYLRSKRSFSYIWGQSSEHVDVIWIPKLPWNAVIKGFPEAQFAKNVTRDSFTVVPVN